MRKRGSSRRLAACLLAAVMMLALMVPTSVSAATVKKRTSAVTISAGESYHIMNTSISTNKISAYTITITPNNSKTRYDVAAASAYTSSNGTTYSTETLLRYYTKTANINNTSGTFVKSSASSNKGMLACISVQSGSVTVQVTYKTTNTGSTKLRFVKQSSSHQALKYVRVRKGKAVRFTMNSGNLTSTPLIFSGRNGFSTIRALSSTSYEKYIFGSSSITYCLYKSGSLSSSRTLSYDTVYSKVRCKGIKMPELNSRWLTTNAGTMTYFYPSDYVGMTYQIATVAH